MIRFLSLKRGGELNHIVDGDASISEVSSRVEWSKMHLTYSFFANFTP